MISTADRRKTVELINTAHQAGSRLAPACKIAGISVRTYQRWTEGGKVKAKKRFGLWVLNYTVTSNHVHLLVYDRKEDVIPKSIQLIAGRTAKEYNIQKNRTGALWEDRYHATAVHTGDHLIRCLAYIDLNMVRAGVVRHPSEWAFGGYTEIQIPKQRYSIVNRGELANLLGIKDDVQKMEVHRRWVEEVLRNRQNKRDAQWMENIAVGDKEFVLETKARLGEKAVGRKISGGKW